jgi:hypothetical protein
MLTAEQPAPELSDEQIMAMIADPATIPTHEIALEVMAVLDAEIANIQTQVDAATIEANIRPLAPNRMAWLKRASYAGAMRRNERQKIYQRDKELRGMKGRAFTEPKHSKEEKALKQQRLMIEAEDRRLKRQLAIEKERTRQMEIAQEKRNAPLRLEIERLRSELAAIRNEE